MLRISFASKVRGSSSQESELDLTPKVLSLFQTIGGKVLRILFQ